MTGHEHPKPSELLPMPAPSRRVASDDNDHRHPAANGTGGHGGQGGHGWMMIACCIPMLLIAVLLVATGAASVGFLGAAIVCTVMMALMMRGMDHSGHDRRDGR
jgi:hypothetical protein